MSRIIYDQNEYYEESSARVPLKNGRALFLAQFQHDLNAARKESEKRKKAWPRQIALGLAWGSALFAFGAFFLWLLISAIRWFWSHPLW